MLIVNHFQTRKRETFIITVIIARIDLQRLLIRFECGQTRFTRNLVTQQVVADDMIKQDITQNGQIEQIIDINHQLIH